jgi:Leucine-rich repeat (LRR) protein
MKILSGMCLLALLFISCTKRGTAEIPDNGSPESAPLLETSGWSDLTENNSEEDTVPDKLQSSVKPAVELKYPNTIVPEDIKNMGIDNLTNMSELLAVLSDEQIATMGGITIENANIESFSGMNCFTRLQQLMIRKSHINSLKDLTLSFSNNWLYLNDSEIETLEGLENIDNLVHLSLTGSHIANLGDLSELSSLRSLESISLERFSDYRILMTKLPKSITHIYLQFNGINSLDEIAFLKDEYPLLKYVYVRGNNFTEDDMNEAQPNWRPVELIWWDDM